MSRINVTKTFLPPIDEYKAYIDKIWESDQLTNQGPLVKELETEIKKYLNVSNFHFVTNGTLALQIALKALGIEEGEVITTPFSYVATTSAILWQKLTPVYVDIDPQTLCIDTRKIEASITNKTKAILAVHVFGNPCDIEEIEKIAKKYNLKVIYDGAHAFGVQYKGRSLLDYGDISICSFHATKLFHTIEGGGVFTKNNEISNRIELIKRFGHNFDDHIMVGLNAKASEFQAAMGIINLKYIDGVIQQRKTIFEIYDGRLREDLDKITFKNYTTQNYSYYPIIFKNEKDLLQAVALLAENDIYPRRYFYPSLNKLPYLENQQTCLVSEDISMRVLCLPVHSGLSDADVIRIVDLINTSFS